LLDLLDLLDLCFLVIYCDLSTGGLVRHAQRVVRAETFC